MLSPYLMLNSVMMSPKLMLYRIISPEFMLNKVVISPKLMLYRIVISPK